MRLSLKKAQKKYMGKKMADGWRNIRFFVPMEVKSDLMLYKNKIMKDYYAKYSRDVK